MPKVNTPSPKPHYVRDYQNMVTSLTSQMPEDMAMAVAVGGEFRSFGKALMDLVIQCGLREGMTLVDVGCGSGRLAHALRDMPITYHGIDVVPELVEYAKRICTRDDWTFDISTDLTIPLPDDSADMVVFVSVFTHLRHEESFVYLMEAKRALKHGGTILFTFLDFAQPHHWHIFQRFVDRTKAGIPHLHVEQFVDKTAIKAWAQMLDLKIKQIFDGSERYIHLSEEITLDNGSKLSGAMTIGQSTCVMQKV
jgi:ubiquinone/menaquinone biosynthesis C-methylase UbiE